MKYIAIGLLKMDPIASKKSVKLKMYHVFIIVEQFPPFYARRVFLLPIGMYFVKDLLENGSICVISDRIASKNPVR